MNSSREEALFVAALARPMAERPVFLDGACLGDATLRERIEALLAAHDGTGVIPAGDSVSEELTPTLELAEPVADEAVGQTLGRYKLLERVGEGGCGVVYVAEQTEPVRRRVALKVIKLGMDTKQVVARFEAERQALAMMDHPNIAKVLDAGTTDMGRPYFVMELVRGIRITDYCDQGNLSTKDRLDLFTKVCQAIQHAHQKGIIHRDIKPSNILVTLHDGVPVPKVIDFGIAKATEGRLTDATVYTQLNQFIGTPAYMSPEQAEMSGLDIDTRSDIYSLGVLLYELLAGSTPFDGKELMSGGIDAMRKTIREKEPQRPSTRLATLGGDELTTKAKRRSADTTKLLHQLKGDLDWIVMKCLEKDRQRRYETANGLAADITRHLNNEPVLARPPSTVYRLQKAFRRNKLLFTSATAVALALVLGLGFAAAGFRQAVLQRDRAEALRVAAEQARGSEAAMRVEAQLAREQALVREEAALMQSYASDMRQVERAVASSDLSLARSLLEGQRPKSSGDRDLRGWEWRHFWEQSRGESNQFLTTVSRDVDHMALRADGHLLALSLGTDLEIWDLRTHSRVFQTTNALGPVFAKAGPRMAFLRKNASNTNMTPTVLNTETWTETTLPEVQGITSVLQFGFGVQDQSLVLHHRSARTGAVTPHFFLAALDSATGRELWRREDVPIRVENAQSSLSDDGRILAVTAPGNQVLVLDTQNGRELSKFQAPDRTPVRIIISHDSSQIRTVNMGYQSSIRLWNARTGESEGQFDGIPDVILQMRFIAKDRYLITSGRDSAVRVWDWQKRRLVRSLMVPEEGINALRVAPDNRTLVTATAYLGQTTNYVRIWDVDAPARKKESRVLSVARTVLGMLRVPVFTADSRSLIGLDEGGVLKQWDMATHSVIRTWPLLGGDFPDVHVDAASKRALALKPGVELRMLNLKDGSMETNSLGDGRFYRAWFVNGEKSLLTVKKSPGEGPSRLNVPTVRTVEVWDLESRRVLESFVYTNLPRMNQVGPTFLSKDRGVFAFDAVGGLGLKILGGTNAPLRFLTMPEGPGSTNLFSAFDISPDRRWVVAARPLDASISLWDLRTSTHSFLPKGRGGVMALFFSPDGTRLVVGDLTGASLNIWDVGSRRQVGAIPVKEFTFSGTFSPDGHTIASYSPMGQLETWTAPSFEEIAAEEARVLPPSRYGRRGTTETKQP